MRDWEALWSDFDRAKAAMDEIGRQWTCWQCGRPMGEDDGLYADDRRVHTGCAGEAKRMFGMAITVEPSEQEASGPHK